MNFGRIVICAVVAFQFVFGAANAEDGHPIAIRHWPGGGFTVETMWDLHVGAGLTADAKKLLPKLVDFEVESMEEGDSITLGRLPNKLKVEAVDNLDHEFDSKFSVEDLDAMQETLDALESNRNSVELSWALVRGAFSLEADGVHVSGLNGLKPADVEAVFEELKDASPAAIADSDGIENRSLCVIATGQEFSTDLLIEIASVAKPEVMIVNASVESVGGVVVEKIEHNTLAISSSGKRKKETRFVSLGTKPYEMSEEVADLFAKKEASQKKSREMFAKLSVEQMNFKPDDGSHTPRWNTEHMMGRELGFFSEIYNAVDPSIPVMNLNPKQMPKDYKFAHADWTGQEEARQMKRVENFTRRFAYLLDGMELDQKAKGSRFWTPRKLLKQMERHYNEHSGNVVKKIELDGWPSDKN